MEAAHGVGAAGGPLQRVAQLLAGVQAVKVQHVGGDDDVLAGAGPPLQPEHVEQAQLELAQEVLGALRGRGGAARLAEAPPSHLRHEAGRAAQQHPAEQQRQEGAGGGNHGRPARRRRRWEAVSAGTAPGERAARRGAAGAAPQVAAGPWRAGRHGGGPVGAQVRGGTKTPRRGIKGSRAGRAGPRGDEGKGRGRPERCPRLAQVCAAAAPRRGDGGGEGRGGGRGTSRPCTARGPGPAFQPRLPREQGGGPLSPGVERGGEKKKKGKKKMPIALRPEQESRDALLPREIPRGIRIATRSPNTLSVPSPLSCGAHGVILRRRRSAAAGPYLSAAGLASAGARAALGLWSPHHLELLRTALLLLLCGCWAESGSSPRCGAPREHAFGGGAGGRRKVSAGRKLLLSESGGRKVDASFSSSSRCARARPRVGAMRYGAERRLSRASFASPAPDGRIFTGSPAAT